MSKAATGAAVGRNALDVFFPTGMVSVMPFFCYTWMMCMQMQIFMQQQMSQMAGTHMMPPPAMGYPPQNVLFAPPAPDVPSSYLHSVHSVQGIHPYFPGHPFPYVVPNPIILGDWLDSLSAPQKPAPKAREVEVQAGARMREVQEAAPILAPAAAASYAPPPPPPPLPPQGNKASTRPAGDKRVVEETTTKYGGVVDELKELLSPGEGNLRPSTFLRQGASATPVKPLGPSTGVDPT